MPKTNDKCWSHNQPRGKGLREEERERELFYMNDATQLNKSMQFGC